LEHYLLQYERFKLQIKYGQSNQVELRAKAIDESNKRAYAEWQKADFSRIAGDIALKENDFKAARDLYTTALQLNNKEYKTWISYSKLNERVFELKGDEVSLRNTIKGLFMAMALSLDRAHFLIP